MCTKNTRYYSVIEVSKLFGVTYDTVRRMIKDGRLDAEKPGRDYMITEESIKRLVKGDKE